MPYSWSNPWIRFRLLSVIGFCLKTSFYLFAKLKVSYDFKFFHRRPYSTSNFSFYRKKFSSIIVVQACIYLRVFLILDGIFFFEVF